MIKKYLKVVMMLATFLVVSVFSLNSKEIKADTSALRTIQSVTS